MPEIVPAGLSNQFSIRARVASASVFLTTTDMPPGTEREDSTTVAFELFCLIQLSTSTRLATVASTRPVSIANRPAPDVRRYITCWKIFSDWPDSLSMPRAM